MDKENLRQHFKELRLQMSSQQALDKSKVITKKLIENIDWDKTKSLHIYEPITSLREVDTRPLIKFLRNKPTVKLSIQSQSASSNLPDEKYDLIIVPTLAFDGRGYRLGWGGGFYDKFLAGQENALKIGLAYQNSFVAEGLPNEAHDIALDKIITEECIIEP